MAVANCTQNGAKWWNNSKISIWWDQQNDMNKKTLSIHNEGIK